MAQSLGTISSGSATQAVQKFFVDFGNRLGTGETISSGTATTTSTEITIASVAANTAKLSSLDGAIVSPTGKAVEFTVTTGKEVATTGVEVPIRVSYTSTDSNVGFMDVSLFISTSPKIA